MYECESEYSLMKYHLSTKVQKCWTNAPQHAHLYKSNNNKLYGIHAH